jgi:hypothetical protein
MNKPLIWTKWTAIALLALIVLLWASYLLDSLKESQHHFFEESNYGLNFLQWINRVSNGALVLRSRMFDNTFYVRGFLQYHCICGGVLYYFVDYTDCPAERE